MIPDAQVEEVRARADIVGVVGELIPLKKAGREFKACCPFHEERTPSFYVVPDKGFYKCFGCGESGDVFGFVMKRLGLDFVDAIKHVAARSGVEIREVRRGREEEDPFRSLYELNAFARDFFRGCLRDPETGRVALDYLTSRGVDPETADRFGLGYAPGGWRALREAAAKHGFSDDDLSEVGLLTKSEKAPEPYDRFRDRVIFPIEGLGGRVVAFGARVLGKGEGGAKYLNSPETPIYKKGEVLYGLSWAKNAIRRERGALVVEGYMDVVAVAAAGVENVVATLGTAMTEPQAQLLSRYAPRAFLLFDSDAAGLRATFKAGDALLAAGVHPAVVTLPPGEDPDTLVRKEGPTGLRHYLDQAVDVLDRKLQILEEKDHFRDIEHTRGAVDRLLPTIRATSDPALRDIYVSKVAERTGVRRETLESELKKRPRGPTGRRDVRDFSRTRARTAPRSPPSLPRMGAERSLLLVMVKNREYVERAAERIGAADFDDAAYRTIFEALVGEPSLRASPSGMDPVAVERLESLLSDPEDVAHASRVFDDSMARVRMDALGRRRKELEERLRASPEPAERAKLEEERLRLLKESREIGPDMSHWARKAHALSEDINPR